MESSFQSLLDYLIFKFSPKRRANPLVFRYNIDFSVMKIHVIYQAPQLELHILSSLTGQPLKSQIRYSHLPAIVYLGITGDFPSACRVQVSYNGLGRIYVLFLGLPHLWPPSSLSFFDSSVP